MKRRRLVSIRRQVPDAGRADYDAAWARVRDEAMAGGAHAWRFTALADPAQSLEFLEFSPDQDPRDAPALARLLSDLAARFGATVEEWEGG